MKDSLLPSLARTVVPLVVYWLLSTKVLAGADEAAVTNLVSGALTVVYYLVGRVLEHYVSPKLGWLLGWGKKPVYAPSEK